MPSLPLNIILKRFNGSCGDTLAPPAMRLFVHTEESSLAKSFLVKPEK